MELERGKIYEGRIRKGFSTIDVMHLFDNEKPNTEILEIDLRKKNDTPIFRFILGSKHLLRERNGHIKVSIHEMMGGWWKNETFKNYTVEEVGEYNKYIKKLGETNETSGI